jgi:hypothetical protein
MPTIDQAFEQFGGTVVFSVLDLNSAYYQIPLSSRSRQIVVYWPSPGGRIFDVALWRGLSSYLSQDTEVRVSYCRK